MFIAFSCAVVWHRSLVESDTVGLLGLMRCVVLCGDVNGEGDGDDDSQEEAEEREIACACGGWP
jgi:hypothetical protein